MLTHDRLTQLLKYSKQSGIFTWREQRQHIKAGTVAGTLKKTGYIEIRIDGVSYQAHRLAWMYVYGSMPEGCLDHKDMNKTNNRTRNLRIATHAENLRNRKVRRDSGTGRKGVYASAHRFKAQITVDGKVIHLGSFSTMDKASDAYAKAAIEYHGAFARTV